MSMEKTISRSGRRGVAIRCSRKEVKTVIAHIEVEINKILARKW